MGPTCCQVDPADIICAAGPRPRWVDARLIVVRQQEAGIGRAHHRLHASIVHAVRGLRQDLVALGLLLQTPADTHTPRTRHTQRCMPAWSSDDTAAAQLAGRSTYLCGSPPPVAIVVVARTRSR